MPGVKVLPTTLRSLVATVLALAVLAATAIAPAAWAHPLASTRAATHRTSGPDAAKKHAKQKHKHKKKHKKKKRHHKKTPSKPTSKIQKPSGQLPASPTPPGTPAPTPTPTPTVPLVTVSPTPVPSPAVTPAVVTHLLAQQGLLVGMASNVLQNQLYLDLGDGDTLASCDALDGGGSSELTSATSPSASEVDETRVLFYATNCTQPYISSTANVLTTATGTTVTATAVYTSPAGTTLGTLSTHASTIDGTSDVKLAGLGTWTPTGGGPAVSLGLTCDAPETSSSTVPPFPCEGGVVQDFPALGRALGSLTPLTMTAGSSGGISFAGSGSTLEVGSPGSLSLGLDPSGALAISGTPLASLSDSLSGSAGAFSLFPPTPTAWSSSDPLDAQSFTIAVTDDTTRDLTGSVSAGAAGGGATFSLDQSGSGTITYTGASPVAVTSWILSS